MVLILLVNSCWFAEFKLLFLCQVGFVRCDVISCIGEHCIRR